jgi:hypothetical protein
MTDTKELGLYLQNDTTSSFELVIIALMRSLRCETLAAEQLAYLAHHRGSIKIKSGDYLELEKIKYEMEEMGLTLTIE